MTRSNPRERVSLFGIEFDRVTMEVAVQRVLDWTESQPDCCRSVVTPNLDHVVQLKSRPDARPAYRSASMVVADGWPVVMASRMFGRRLPERVAGSDLIPRVFSGSASYTEPRTVFLLGAAPGVAERAAQRIRETWDSVRVVGTDSPPFGFEFDADENERILKLISRCKPDLLVVGFGAPKQEVWIHRHLDRIDAKVALAVGATIDFLAGEKSRAPVWMRCIGLEWLHRMATEPRRLFLRYVQDAWGVPGLLWREWHNPG